VATEQNLDEIASTAEEVRDAEQRGKELEGALRGLTRATEELAAAVRRNQEANGRIAELELELGNVANQRDQADTRMRTLEAGAKAVRWEDYPSDAYKGLHAPPPQEFQWVAKLITKDVPALPAVCVRFWMVYAEEQSARADAAEKHAADLTERLEATDAARMTLAGEVERLTEDRDRLVGELELVTEQAEQERDSKELNDEKVEHWQKVARGIQSDRDRWMRDYDRQVELTGELRERFNSSQEEVDRLQGALHDQTARNEEVVAAGEAHLRELERLTAELKRFRDPLPGDRTWDGMSAELWKARDEVERLKGEVEEAKADATRQAEAAAWLVKSLREQKAESDRLRAELAKCETKLDAARKALGQ